VDIRQPPAAPCGSLRHDVIPAGSTLWRVHRTRHPAAGFCPDAADQLFGGGRFDSTSSDVYPFLYAARTPETALCETLLRGLRFRGRSRQLLRHQVTDRVLSSLTTTTTLTLLSLASTVDLASICQPDDWLLRAEGHEYAHTRAWAHWLRRQAATVHGFVWLSRHNLPDQSIIIFGDRCPRDALKPDPSMQPVQLDTAAGAAYLNSRLGPYGVTIAPPRP
jgi:hypothetical protein